MSRDSRILQLLRELIAADSETGTAKEQAAEEYLLRLLSSMKGNIETGRIPVPDDRYQRAVIYGFIEGTGKKTVIFMNHHDVVSCEAYGDLAPLAFSPDELREALLQSEEHGDVRRDLESGQWLFGRGSCDMKGGTAAQLAVFEEYAAAPGRVNLLFLSVPDEESYSAGMRAALPFLQVLQQQRRLQYSLLVNCEPNQMEQGRLVAYTGSVGKLLPVVIVQGKAVHISQYKQGLNPLAVIARMIVATEGNWQLADYCGSEITPPPVWMYARDCKEQYDFSLPWRASAYASFLTFEKTAEDVLQLLQHTAEQAVRDTLTATQCELPVEVISYSCLLERATLRPGFDEYYKSLQEAACVRLSKGSTYPAETIAVMTGVLDFIGSMEGVVVVGYAPPYYPAVDSFCGASAQFIHLLQQLVETEPLCFQHYFTGVSDCSYCGLGEGASFSAFQSEMPLWGRAYSFNCDSLAALHIPFLLLGPWGKDLHCRTERVHIASVTQTLPKRLTRILNFWLEN